MRDPAAFAALVSLAQEYAASVQHEIDVIAGLGKLRNRQNSCSAQIFRYFFQIKIDWIRHQASLTFMLRRRFGVHQH